MVDMRFGYRLSTTMNEYIQLNHLEMVKDDRVADVSRVYYIPHHLVTKEDSTTTKLRVVFDALCKTTTGTVQNTLTTILMR